MIHVDFIHVNINYLSLISLRVLDLRKIKFEIEISVVSG